MIQAELEIVDERIQYIDGHDQLLKDLHRLLSIQYASLEALKIAIAALDIFTNPTVSYPDPSDPNKSTLALSKAGHPIGFLEIRSVT
jgi:hypothetical protein